MARNRSTSKKKKKKYKKLKGVRYIAQKLRKYYPKRYTTFNSALERSRVIVDELKTKGLKVSVVNMFSLERVHRKPKENIPEVPFEFLQPQDFFTLTDYPLKIEEGLPKNLFLLSKISLEELPMLKCGVDNESELGLDVYNNYFKGFVRFGNELQTSTQTRYPLKFKLTEPSDKIEKGKWISLIISCDEEGEKLDYGFDPKNFVSPEQLFVKEVDYSTWNYNALRKEISLRKIEAKNPTKDDMIRLLKEDDNKRRVKEFLNSKEQKKKQDISSENLSPKDKIEFKKEENKAKELENKKLAELNRKKELEIEERKLNLREQELDMEKIQYGLMTPAEFKKKWANK